MAKAPVPGQAKTRLAASVGDAVAADLAAAAFLDTLDLVAAAFPTDRTVVALSGDLDRAARSDEISSRLKKCSIVPQRGSSFAERLANAHADLPQGSGVVQIGMDTPHLTEDRLRRAAEGLTDCDAVVGPTEDGGWWVLALRDPREAGVLRDVPMSSIHTARRTVEALAHLRVRITDETYDIDRWADAERAADEAPRTRFAQTWRSR